MRLTKKNDGAGSWTQFGDKYLPAHNIKHKECVNKLGELEDIEDELGIDLTTLFKAMLQGIYYKGAYGTNDYGKIVYKEHPTIIFETTSKLYCFKPTFFDFINLKDYGKTWALTKEELL